MASLLEDLLDGPTLSEAHQRLVRKLSAVRPLAEDDVRALSRLPLRLRGVDKGVDLVREGQRPSECCLLIEGFTFRYKLLGQGQRQIFSFHIAGDIIDVQSLHLEVQDHSVATLTPCRVGYIPHPALLQLLSERPNLASVFWRETLIDAAVFREWLAGVGRRSAYQRIAHLFCELFVRMQSVGLADELAFTLPITQGELADSLGLSAVHVNRVMQQLRAEGLIRSRGAHTTIGDWEGLQRAGDFDPAYLHLSAAAA